MMTSEQNQLKVSIVTFFMCVIHVNGNTLSITTNPLTTYESTNISLICSIPAFTGGAEWIKNGVSLTLCLSGACFPLKTGRYQYSATPGNMTVAISSLNRTQDEGTWTCVHNTGVDTGDYIMIVYKTLSAMSINGPTNSTVTGNVTVHLSVNTGCIHPSGSAYYTFQWEYLEASTTAWKIFQNGTEKNVTSLGGCSNVDEDNIMLNLYLTNKINPYTTPLYISQIRMTFTMAGRSVSDSLNVAYNVTGSGTPINSTSGPPPPPPPPGNQLALGLGLGLGLGIPAVIIAIVILVKTCDKLVEKPPEPTGDKPEQITLKPTSQDDKIKNTGSSAVSREHVEIQVDKKGVKGDEEERFPAVHTETQNKVETKTSNKHSNDNQPTGMPPRDTGFENKPKIRPQPQPPENSDIKDQTLRGISANFDDTLGLANETPRPNKLPPLEDVSEETKKKRKKKKKKGQTNDGNPEEGMVQLKSTRKLPVPGDQSN